MSEKIDFNKMGDNHERRIFKINVADIPKEDVEDYIKKVMEDFKKPPWGKEEVFVDYKMPEEDIYIPKRDNDEETTN